MGLRQRGFRENQSPHGSRRAAVAGGHAAAADSLRHLRERRRGQHPEQADQPLGRMVDAAGPCAQGAASGTRRTGGSARTGTARTRAHAVCQRAGNPRRTEDPNAALVRIRAAAAVPAGSRRVAPVRRDRRASLQALGRNGARQRRHRRQACVRRHGPLRPPELAAAPRRGDLVKAASFRARGSRKLDSRSVRLG